MCGRFTRVIPAWTDELDLLFGLAISRPPLESSWNVAPTQQVQVVRVNPETGARELLWMTWGLIPSWAKDRRIGSDLINARGETVAVKPAFRSSFRKRRCLILTTGFYEWQPTEGGKQPWFIRLTDRAVFAFAGIWDRWAPPEGPPVQSCAIITIEANELMRTIHHRMPVILDPQDYGTWLDPAVQDPAVLTPLLAQYPAARMTAHPVSRNVNSPKLNDPRLVEPVEPPKD